jgi:hypothetical protein
MTTDSFIAERQPNGDVLIYELDVKPKESDPLAKIRIPKKHCAELAKTLLPDLGGYIEGKVVQAIKLLKGEPVDYSIDFTRTGGEPE